MSASAAASSVPTFYLYGEPPRQVEERFVHVESLDDRSRPSEWTIRAHAHAELSHVFHVRHGGGALRADAATLPFAAPCLIVVPAGSVHGFDWVSESRGTVVTASIHHLDRMARSDTALMRLFEHVRVIALERAQDDDVARTIALLMRELGWGAPGYRAAGEAHLLHLLVQVLRLNGPERDARARAPGSSEALVARFRQRVEERYWLREPIAAYAGALGASESRLRAACATIARESPTRILDGRALLEAQRALLYSNLTIGEIARRTGFEDAAYFSRFFRRHVGRSPRRFREATGRADR